ncbi:hypothetical protein KIPB_010112, partial [Kipferlia bialata]
GYEYMASLFEDGSIFAYYRQRSYRYQFLMALAGIQLLAILVSLNLSIRGYANIGSSSSLYKSRGLGEGHIPMEGTRTSVESTVTNPCVTSVDMASVSHNDASAVKGPLKLRVLPYVYGVYCGVYLVTACLTLYYSTWWSQRVYNLTKYLLLPATELEALCIAVIMYPFGDRVKRNRGDMDSAGV